MPALFRFLEGTMTISVEAARHALALALATPMTGRLKPRHSRSDFDGEDSHLLKVRRVGRDYPCGDDVRDGDFGFYLGAGKKTGKRGDGETRRGERAERLKAERWADAVRNGETSFCRPCFCQSFGHGDCATPSGLAMGAGPLTQGARTYRDPGLRCATPSA